MSNTLLAIMQEVAKRHPDLGRLGTVSGAADASEFQSNAFYGVTARDLVMPGAPVYVDTGSYLGETVYVSKTPGPTSNAVEVVPAFSGTLNALDTIQTWHRDLSHTDRIKECINRALTQYCHRWVLMPVTMLLDGDMQKAAYADWTAGSSATLAKTVWEEGEPVRQALWVINTGATSGYAYQSVQAHTDERFSLIVMCRPAAGDVGKVTVYDSTNAADVSLSGDTGETTTANTWHVLRTTFTLPSACRAFQVRFGVATASDDAYYAWAALQRQDVNEVVLPDRIKSAEYVGRVFRAPRRITTPLEPAFSWGLEQLDVEKFSTRGTGGVTLRFPCALGSDLWLYEEAQSYESLATDAATTEAPLDLVAEAAALEMYYLAYNSYRAGTEQRVPQAGVPTIDPNPWGYALKQQEQLVRRLQRDAVGSPIVTVQR